MHWSDLQDNVDESVSPELIEGWNMSRDELSRIEAAEAYRAEVDDAEAAFAGELASVA